MKWKGIFGLVAVGVGVFVMYAAWGSAWGGTIFSATACAVGNPDGVHFTEQWTLEYHNACGGHYDYFLLYLMGLTAVGIILIGGGAETLRETMR